MAYLVDVADFPKGDNPIRNKESRAGFINQAPKFQFEQQRPGLHNALTTFLGRLIPGQSFIDASTNSYTFTQQQIRNSLDLLEITNNVFNTYNKVPNTPLTMDGRIYSLNTRERQVLDPQNYNDSYTGLSLTFSRGILSSTSPAVFVAGKPHLFLPNLFVKDKFYEWEEAAIGEVKYGINLDKLKSKDIDFSGPEMLLNLLMHQVNRVLKFDESIDYPDKLAALAFNASNKIVGPASTIITPEYALYAQLLDAAASNGVIAGANDTPDLFAQLYM